MWRMSPAPWRGLPHTSSQKPPGKLGRVLGSDLPLPSPRSQPAGPGLTEHSELTSFAFKTLLTSRQFWPPTSTAQAELSNPEALLGPTSQAPYAAVLPSASRWDGLSGRGTREPGHAAGRWVQTRLRPSSAGGHSPAPLRSSLVAKGAGCCQCPLNSAEGRRRIRAQSALSSQGLSNG